MPGRDINTEAKIRDYLANHLDLIEQGLQLSKVGYKLPNAEGAGGSIDILARDKIGILVVIEIKKSNNSAREALHELYKYVALLRTNHGLESHQIRCILVSTEWHELLTPFSSFVRTVNYSVEGYLLKIENDGLPCKASKVELAPEGNVRKLCPEHMIYFYYDSESRKQGKTKLYETLLKVGISDYCIVESNHKPGDIPYPFALYLAIDALTPQVRSDMEQQHDVEEDFVENENDDKDDNWVIEEAILCDINSSFGKYCHSMEIGYPEKFADMLESWEIREIHRNGRLSSTEVIPDQKLIEDLAGIGGAHDSIYTAVTSLKYSLHWQNALKRAQYALLALQRGFKNPSKR